MLTRRRRLILITAAAAVAFAAITVALLVSTRETETYRPGEPIEGLTAGLTRDLPDDHPRVTFEDVTARAGIHFTHFSGRRSSQLPEDIGSGAAWGDYDNDGWLDLFLVNTVGPLTASLEEAAASSARAALYRNNGDGTFTDVTAQAGVGLSTMGMGAEWADADNDGLLDLVVTAYGRNTFFRNNGDGTFTDRSDASGLGAQTGFWTGAAWGDYDRDGRVDLYVVGYVQYSATSLGATSKHYDVEEPASINPSSFPPERNLLYHNEGNGRFSEVAARAGVANPEGRGLEASWTDFDRDGWPDLYVANDVSDNVLYQNLGDGTFRDVSHQARVADYRGAMGIAVGDWDNDQDMDMLVTHWIAQENALYVNKLTELAVRMSGGARPALQFGDEADRFGLGQIALDFVGWGAGFFDYDNNGTLDLLVVNGSTLQEPDRPERLVPMRDQMFWNQGGGRGFFDVSSVSGPYFQESHVGRGAAFADYDNDGNVDLVIVNHGEPAVLLRNTGHATNAWVAFRLAGRRSNRSALGAKLRLVAAGQQIREVGASSSYLSQDALTQHFGLGAAARVDTLEIIWPSGARQVLVNLDARTIHVVVEEPGAR